MMSTETENGRGFVILMYHHIVDTASSAAAQRDVVYDVELASFENQMKHLSFGGYHVMALSEFMLYREEARPLPPSSVVLTFDDGDRSNVEQALPVLTRYGFKAEFFLTVEHLGAPGYLSWDQAHLLVQAGMGIGSHLMHHVYLDDLDTSTAYRELNDSRNVLSERLNSSVDFLAPPGGRITAALEKAAATIGYRGVCNSRIGINRIGCDPFRLRRIPIVGATSLESFGALVDQRRAAIWRRQASSRGLAIAKRAWGNQRYDRLRQQLLARRHER